MLIFRLLTSLVFPTFFPKVGAASVTVVEAYQVTLAVGFQAAAILWFGCMCYKMYHRQFTKFEKVFKVFFLVRRCSYFVLFYQNICLFFLFFL